MAGVGANRGAHEAFFEHGPGMLFIASTRGTILRLNGASRSVFGPDVTEGTPFLERVHPDDRDRVATDWRGMVQGGAGEPVRSLCRLRIEDGSYRAFALSAVRAPASEEIHGVLSSAVVKASPVAVSLPSDKLAAIERDGSEAAQKQEAMLLRTLLDKLPILAFRVDQRGAITYQDGRGSEALGLAPGQLCGMSLFALYADRPEDLARVQRALEGQQSHALSEIYGVPWESWYIPCPDEHGEIASMLGISLHIGDLKRAEQELSQKIVLAVEQQRMIRVLSGIILEVWRGVLTLPVLGVMSGELAEQTMAALLNEVSLRRARHVIVDLTGAGEVGAETAHHVLRLVRAIRLLGADGIITGIQPEVAHTMVSLDVNLSGIRTFANLREGLQFCMKAPDRAKNPVTTKQ
jgi:rsbT co-antagonist protein RsbR